MTERSHNLSLEEMDRQSVLHPFTHAKDYAAGELGDPRIVTGGSGVTIRDQKGREYVDGFAGLYCVNVGYGRQEIADAIYAQATQLAYYHAYAMHSNEPTIRLSDRLLRDAPNNMQRVYYGMSGSDANETQAKLVWYYNNVRGKPEKKKIIARHRGYHGASVCSGSMTGLPVFHQAFDLPIDRIKHAATPHYYWNAHQGESEQAFSKRLARSWTPRLRRRGRRRSPPSSASRCWAPAASSRRPRATGRRSSRSWTSTTCC